MTISRTSESGSLAYITLAVSLLGVFATACSSKPAATNPATTTPPSANTIGRKSAATTGQTVTAGVRINSATPIAISSLAEFGENAYDAATASSWVKASAIVDSLAAGEPGLPTPSAEMNNTIQSLKSAIASKDRPPARRYANAVTRIATQMSAHYTDPTPSDIAMLDFYGREIELGAAAKDLAALKETASNIDTTWARVRPLVESHGGSAVARIFGEIITKLNAANSPPEYGRLATPILDQVDNLEKVFTK